MARAINKPVVFVLLGVLVVLLGVGGFIAFKRADRRQQLTSHQEKLEQARQEKDVRSELLEMQIILTDYEPGNEVLREEYAERLEEAGDSARAQNEWRVLVDKNPENVKARMRLAEYALSRGEYAEAGHQAGEVMSRDEGNVKAHLLMAKSYYGRGLYSEASVEAQRVIDLAPENVEGYIVRAEVLRKQGDPVKAEETAALGMKAVPDSDVMQMYAGNLYRDRGELEKAEEAYKAALSTTKRKADPLLQLGLLYAVQRKNEEAETKYKEAVAASETIGEKLQTRLAYAKFLTWGGRLDDALVQYDEALKVQEKNPAVLAERAMVLMSAGRLDSRSGEPNAESDIGDILSRTAHDAYLVQGLHLQGRLRVLKGDVDGAIESLEKALEENANLPRPITTLQVTQVLAGCYERKGDTVRSRDLLTKVLEKSPEDWTTRFMLGRVLSLRGEYDRVVSLLSGRRLPLDGVLLLAQAQTDRGDASSGRRTLETLIEQRPEEIRARLGLMRLEYVAKDYRRMLSLSDDLLKSGLAKTAAEQLTVKRMRVVALIALEEFGEAEKAYKELLEAYPEEMDIIRNYALFLLSQKRFAEGESFLRGVMEKSDKKQTEGLLASYYERADRPDLARAEWRRLAEQYPKSATIREHLILLALMERDNAEAQKYQTELKTLLPDNPTVEILGARVLLARGEYGEASQILKAVVEKSPRDAEARYYLGVTDVALGRGADAVKNMEVVLSLWPQFRRAQELLANLYFETGQVAKAEQMLRLIKEGSRVQLPEEEEDRLQKLESMVDVSMGRPEEAEKKLRAYLKDNPGDGASWLSLGDALFSQAQDLEKKGQKAESGRKKDEAEKAYLTSWEKGLHTRRALFAITRFYVLGDHAESALKVVESATSEDASSPGPLREDVASLALLAKLYEQGGRNADSEKVYERIGKVDPGNLLGLLNKAERLSREGKFAEATAVMEDVMSKAPDDKEIRRRLVGSLMDEWRASQGADRSKYERATRVVEDGLQRVKDPSDRLELKDMKASVLASGLELGKAEEVLKEAIQEGERTGLGSELLQVRFHLAGYLMLRGANDAAMDLLRQVVNQEPRFLDARTELMRLYVKSGRYPEARAEALAILENGPALGAYLTLGDLGLNQGNPNEAIKQYTIAVEKFPESALAKRGLGAAYLRKGDKAKALATLREAMVQGKYDYSEMRVMTEILISEKSQDEALSLLQEAVGKAEPKGGAEYLMGVVESSREQHGPACRHYESAVKAMPDSLSYRMALGREYFSAGDYENTKKTAEEILEKNAGAVGGYELLLAVHEKEGDKGKQEDVFRRWIRSSPESVVAVNNYAFFLAEQDKASQALSLLEDLKQKQSGKPEYSKYEPVLLDTEGWVRFKMGETRRAKELLEEAKKRRPDSPEVLNHLRLVYLKLRDDAKARGDNAQARMYEVEAGRTTVGLMQAMPGDPEMQINLARVYAVEGRLDEAIASLRQAVAVEKEGNRARKALVELLIRKPLLEDASRELETLKKAAPEDPMTTVLEVMLLTKRAEVASVPEVTPEATNLLKKAQEVLSKGLVKWPEEGMMHYVQAQVSLRMGKLDEAEKELGETIRLLPNFMDAYLGKTQLLTERGKLDEAAATCEEILKRSPRHFQAHLTLGNLLLAQRKVEEAEKRFRIMLAEFPTVPVVHERLGNVLGVQRKYADALSEYEAARKGAPNDLSLLQATAGLNLRLGRGERALADGQKFVSENRTNALGYVTLGQLYEQSGQRSEAEEAYQKAITNGPREVGGYVSLADFYLREKRYDQAILQADKMIQAGVSPARAWRMKGSCYEQKQDWDNAEKAYRAGLAAFPQDVMTANELAWMLLDRKGQVDEAIKVAEAGMKQYDAYWPLLDTTGYAYYLKGDYAKAIPYLEKAVVLMKAPQAGIAPAVLVHSGMALLKGGREAEGKARVAEALAIEPKLALPEWVREIMQSKP